MKILKIEFENLNSLRGVQTIDLQSGELAEAGIFAITGPTGAGKSTILDAITLALYGRAARYGSSPSPENMMSRHTGFCRSEIVFETSTGRYRSAWLLNRARKKPDGKIQPAKHQVFDQDERPLTQKIKETAGKIEELIGLDFDRFLRSVLLAQGEFAKFLKSDINERSRLLESLTGTGIYSSLSQLAYEHHKAHETQLKQREAELNAVVLLSEDEVAEKSALSKKLTDELKSLKQKLEVVRKRVDLGRQLRDSNESKIKLEADLKSLNERGKALEADEQRLKAHQTAFAFKPELGQLDQLKTQWSDSTELLRRAVEETETSSQALKFFLQQGVTWLGDRDNKLQQQLNAESERQKTLTKTQTDLSRWLEANKVDSTLQRAIPGLRTNLEKLKSAQSSVTETTDQLKKLTSEIENCGASIKATKEKIKSANTDIKTQQTALNQQKERLAAALDGVDPKSLQDERDQLTQKVAGVNAMLEQQSEAETLKRSITEKQTAIALLQKNVHQQEQSLGQATKSAESQEEICSALEIAVEQARLIADLTDHRANLKDGEACPLCGSLEHPAIDGEATSSLASVQAKFTAAREKLTELKSSRQAQSESLSVAKATLKNNQKEIENEQDRLVKIESTLAERASQLGLVEDDAKKLAVTKSMLETQLDKLKRRMKQTGDLQESVQASEQAVQNSVNGLDLLSQSLKSSNAVLNDLHVRQDDATKRLDDANIDVQSQTDRLNETLNPFELLAPGVESVKAFQESLDRRSELFQTRNQELATLESQLAESKQLVKDLTREKKEIENELDRFKSWTNEEPLRSVSLPEAADTRKKSTWSTAAELVEKAVSLRSAWQQAISREQDRKDGVAKAKKAFQSASIVLLDKIVQGGFENIEQLETTLLADEVASKITDDLEQHKQKLNKMLGQLEQLETTIATLQKQSAPTKNDLAKLESERAQADDEAGVKHKELASIESVLDADVKQRQMQEQAQKDLLEQRQQLATWQRLNEIMGSSDGKKFRTFAQGISLDLVIRHANQHLTELSKRYRLRRRAADSLGLEICDLHQANVLRPMESLSGGESFVVSLALALGLSDLAGQSVRIDSLFIDEGFGTLDPETLDMAVAALERLQARNKTIGVISHVELLKERITTQIQVQPKAGGTSELKIVA